MHKSRFTASPLSTSVPVLTAFVHLFEVDVAALERKHRLAAEVPVSGEPCALQDAARRRRVEPAKLAFHRASGNERKVARRAVCRASAALIYSRFDQSGRCAPLPPSRVWESGTERPFRNLRAKSAVLENV